MTKVLGGVALAVVLALPVVGQAQSMQQMLGGLMTGNQNQDQAIRDAYERGYQRGRQDEAQLARGGRQDQNSRPYNQNDQYRR